MGLGEVGPKSRKTNAKLIQIVLLNGCARTAKGIHSNEQYCKSLFFSPDQSNACRLEPDKIKVKQRLVMLKLAIAI